MDWGLEKLTALLRIAGMGADTLHQAPSWMGPAWSQPRAPGTAVPCQHTQRARCEHKAPPPAQGVLSTHSSDWPSEVGTHTHSPEISHEVLSPQPTVHELK